MREIKFRAWDKEKKKMIYDEDNSRGYCSTDEIMVTNHGIIHNRETLVDGGYDGFGKWERDCRIDDIKNFILMQYTGLKDKNGKEIYEGDIVRVVFRYWQDNPLKTNSVAEGYWEEKVLEKILQVDIYLPKTINNILECIKLGTCLEDSTRIVDDAIMEKMEVIGNIYENPELLGGE